MKFNAKLGGATCYLDKTDHPLFGKDPSIIIGADVSHPSPGMVKPSFASMVGSVDCKSFLGPPPPNIYILANISLIL